MRVTRFDLLVVITAPFFAVSGCGGGCSGCGMAPIPGGFSATKRAPNAGQIRIAKKGLDAVSTNAGALVGALGGGSNGMLSFNVPATCGGSTPVCCPGGNPQNPCGPIDIDVTQHPGDSARL